jgi:two-component system chemotaxis response regulator CheY
MGKKVIVVDDSRTARQQIINALADTSYEVVEAVDGIDGMEKLALHPDASVVICDVNMPKMSGLEMLTEAMKAEPPLAVPFLMLTTEAQPELVEQAKQAGAKAWIIKPFKHDMLLAVVRRLAG